MEFSFVNRNFEKSLISNPEQLSLSEVIFTNVKHLWSRINNFRLKQTAKNQCKMIYDILKKNYNKKNTLFSLISLIILQIFSPKLRWSEIKFCHRRWTEYDPYSRILKPNSSWIPTWAKFWQLIATLSIVLHNFNQTKFKLEYLKFGFCSNKERYKYR